MSTPAPGGEICILIDIYLYSKNAEKVTNF
jgi:hypothetical protein